MVSCEECGKKLRILEGYCHPTMGKKHHLCSPCFDQVSESVAKWREFVMSNSFNVNAAASNTSIDWKQFAPVSNLESPMTLPDLSLQELQRWKKKAFRAFYLRPRYLYRKLKSLRSCGDIVSVYRGFKTFLNIT